MLDGVNTEAAEQLFSWLKGYASILSSIGWKRSLPFLLILFHNKNLERKNIRPNQTLDIVRILVQRTVRITNPSFSLVLEDSDGR